MRLTILWLATFTIALASARSIRADDLVEFLSGAKATGTVKSIRKADKEFDIEVTVGGRTTIRTYPFAKVHAVTLNGKRHELTPLPVASAENGKRSKAEVLELIKSVGSTPPDWYEETALDHPDTLDLSWPLKPPTKGWNAKVNVGQYLWDTVNPNPSRWKSGAKLLHHVMSLHKDDPVLLSRDMRTLGNMYFNLFQDYPRAAFWLGQSEGDEPRVGSVSLAECYWRLGNEAIALELLRGSDLPLQAIKLLGDMGYTDRSISLAKRFSTMASQQHVAYLLAGDACRTAGRLDDAIEMYEQVLAMGDARNQQYTTRYLGRAKDSIEAIRLSEKARVDQVADGTYRETSVGYNGPLEVEVTVDAGKIVKLRVSDHQEKQFYAALTDTPNQIMKNQSIENIDGTSGATITSVAIINATAKALASGAK